MKQSSRKLPRLTPQRVVLMRSLLSVVILMPLTTGCAEAIFKYKCPTLRTYTKDFQLQAADEKKGPRTKELVSDYGQLRDACRALKEE